MESETAAQHGCYARFSAHRSRILKPLPVVVETLIVQTLYCFLMSLVLV